MKILVKYPTRSRPAEFTIALGRAIKNQTTENVDYLISYDEDDHTMTNGLIEVVCDRYKNVIFKKGRSASKIHACNRDIATYTKKWDIIVLLSDDMICNQKGWDELLIKEMETYYPDTDGVLFHNDGYVGNKLNTMCILGKKYYDRFGYIYNPNYLSLWCDNEFMDVANKLNKQTYFDTVIFKHNHPANTGDKHVYDNLYRTNDKHYSKDKSTYEKRKRNGFA